MRKTDKVYRLLCGLTAAAAALTALVFAGECLHIYLGGTSPMYTEKNLADGLKRCLWFLTICALFALLADCFRRRAIHPREVFSISAQNRLRLMKKTVLVPASEALAIEKRMKTVKWISAAVMVLCLIYPIVYFSNRTHFEDWQLNRMFLKTMLNTFPGFTAVLIVHYFRETLLDRYALKEIELIKTAPSGKPAEDAVALKKNRPPQALTAVRAVILILAVGLIVVGIFNGSMDDVLKKAIAICTECIGLG